MKEMLEEAARESGASPKQVEKALGVLLGFLQDCCEEASMRRLHEQVPPLVELTPPRRPRGLFGAMLGGNAALLGLPGKLRKVGIERAQISKLVPVVLRWLKAETTGDLWQEIEGQLPRALFG